MAKARDPSTRVAAGRTGGEGTRIDTHNGAMLQRRVGNPSEHFAPDTIAPAEACDRCLAGALGFHVDVVGRGARGITARGADRDGPSGGAGRAHGPDRGCVGAGEGAAEGDRGEGAPDVVVDVAAVSSDYLVRNLDCLWAKLAEDEVEAAEARRTLSALIGRIVLRPGRGEGSSRSRSRVTSERFSRWQRAEKLGMRWLRGPAPCGTLTSGPWRRVYTHQPIRKTRAPIQLLHVHRSPPAGRDRTSRLSTTRRRKAERCMKRARRSCSRR